MTWQITPGSTSGGALNSSVLRADLRVVVRYEQIGSNNRNDFFECLLAIVCPLDFYVFLKKAIKWCSNIAQIRDELAIVVDHAEKRPKLRDVCWDRHVRYRCRSAWVRAAAMFVADASKIFHFGLGELTFVQSNVKTQFVNSLKESVQVPLMIFFRSADYDDVVKICDYSAQSCDHRVHDLLKDARADFTPKGRRL
uniref:Uncharacterized protein n=1 Tax=Trichuris muris TaxID=70415 RepID=A0A5S6QGP7_TRIMR